MIFHNLESISLVDLVDPYMYDTAHFCVHPYDICGQTTALLFARKTEFLKTVLKVELCFHRYVHFACVLIYIFGLHHKQCASD